MTGFTWGGTDGALYGTSDGALYATSDAINPGQIRFRIVRQPSGKVDTDTYDINPLRDAFEMFQSGTRAHIIDTDGTTQANYPYGQRVEVQYSTDGGSTWKVRQACLTHDTIRTNRDGTLQVELDLVKYDHLLRRRKVYKDYSSTTRENILNDLITNFTPVSWVAGNVTVVNNDSVDLPLRGTRVDEAIKTLAKNSANEEWGVNNDLEFFFREQDISRAPAIGDGDVIDYDLPEEGKRAINRFKLFYDSDSDGTAESFVVVEDREAQNTLKNNLNADRRVVVSDSDTMTEISTEARAEKVARQRLGEQSVVQTGTVTVPIGRFDTESGNIFDLTISDAGINGVAFRVAQIDYNWLRGTAVLTIAENTADNVDALLADLSDSLSNVRARAADTAATGTRYLEQRSGVEFTLDVTVRTKTLGDGFVLGQSQLGSGTSDELGGQIDSTASVSVDTKTVTKALLDMARDVWQGDSFTDNTHLGFGTDDSPASKVDNSLQKEIGRTELSRYGEGNSSVTLEWVGEAGAGGPIASGGNVEEVMVFDSESGGDGYVRFTTPATALDGSTKLTVQIEATVDADADEEGIITTTGQERLVDLLVGDTGHEPTDMVYGTDGTDATESDTALGTQVHEDTIDSTADKSTGITDIIERIGSGEVNGNDIAEIGYENASDELLARVTIEPLSKTSNFALESNYRFRASNP